MRMNRGTITLVVVGIIVIIGAILINNYQTNNPNATPTPTPQTGGPLFTDLTSDDLTRIVVRDNTNGARTILVRDSEGTWQLGELSTSGEGEEATDEATDEPDAEATEEATEESAEEATPEATAVPTGTELDQTRIQTTLDGLIALAASDRFDSDQLEGFGLNQPSHSIYVTTTEGVVHVLHVGGENPSGNRYYVVQEEFSGDELPPEVEGGAVATTIVEDTESQGGDSATEEATDEAEEVEVAEDVAEAIELGEQIEATNAAVAETMSEATDEATDEPEVEPTEEATEEATEEPDAEATQEATNEAGATVALPTPTPTPLPEPLVTLSGSQTINTVPKTTIDQLIGYITAPPYFVPTPTPTLPITLPEVTEESTPEATEEATEEPEAEPTEEATEEATPEATAES